MTFNYEHTYKLLIHFPKAIWCIFLTSLQDLEEFVNGSGDDGFIVFTLGSMVNSMPEEKAKVFFDAFRQIPQRVTDFSQFEAITYVSLQGTPLITLSKQLFVLFVCLHTANIYKSARDFQHVQYAKAQLRMNYRTLSLALLCRTHAKLSFDYIYVLHVLITKASVSGFVEIHWSPTC